MPVSAPAQAAIVSAPMKRKPFAEWMNHVAVADTQLPRSLLDPGLH